MNCQEIRSKVVDLEHYSFILKDIINEYEGTQIYDGTPLTVEVEEAKKALDSIHRMFHEVSKELWDIRNQEEKLKRFEERSGVTTDVDQ